MRIRVQNLPVATLCIAILSLLLVASPLPAQTCKAEIDAISDDIGTLAFAGKNADRDKTNLLIKLSNAELKLDAGKPCDALAKLEDVQDKVDALIRQGKLTGEPEKLSKLRTDLEAAMDCVKNRCQ